MIAFQRKSDALNVTMVYNATSDPRPRGFDPDEAPLTGSELFQIVFSAPEDDPPKNLWPGVIGMLNNFKSELAAGVKPVYFSDPRVRPPSSILSIEGE